MSQSIMKSGVKNMRNLKCSLTVAVIFFATTVDAQELTMKVSFSAPAGKPLINTLEEFADKTRMRLVYSKADINDLKVREVKCDNLPVNDCLKNITDNLPVAVRQRGELISVKYQGQNTSISSARGNGRLTGKIVDEVGNPIVKAEVSVAGKTAATDNNGDFSISIPAGVYTLSVKASGFSSLRVEKLQISNDDINTVSFAMKHISSDKEMNIKEVVLTGTRKADTQAGLLAQQKKAAQMSDGISAEQISKTPDNDVGGT